MKEQWCVSAKKCASALLEVLCFEGPAFTKPFREEAGACCLVGHPSGGKADPPRIGAESHWQLCSYPH
jgi:hypothetical protein